MKVMITGASGFVGRHVARLLVDRGDQVVALVRSSSPVAHLVSMGCSITKGNLLDIESLNRAMDGCDQIYHIAADYRLWSRDTSELYRNNVDGTRNVMAAAQKVGAERVVYTSTVGTLGIPKGGAPGNERTPVTLDDMVGHYKRSKFMAEEAVRDFAAQGLPVVIVNPSTPVGEEDVKPTPTGKVIVDFLNGRIPAFLDTGLNLVDVHDAANGHLLAAKKGAVGERYILGGRNMTLQDILTALAEVSGRKPPHLRIPYGMALGAAAVDHLLWSVLLKREPHISLESVRMAAKKMYFDSERAMTELGYTISPIKPALQRAVEWYRQNGYEKIRSNG
ncbi:MAG: NAD-dependent epimerase/dehydratase family protein [Armatimonadetes bacterium]|nr:NAD-dependent epimerase/dehydratase family protein [Armatimonadota bacterium]